MLTKVRSTNKSGSRREMSPKSRRRAVSPIAEVLESRMLLYSTLGGQWSYASRITYSFMPDGTNVAGTPSNLFATLNAKYATSTWQTQIEIAASLWENVTPANIALVSDGGQDFGTNGNQQDDPRFGDIRIGMIPLSGGVLAETFDPPPINGGTAAGDIMFNSNVNWQIGSSYDLMTVAIHEFGHSLGLGESSVSTAAMYGTYNGIKTALTNDDITGIQSLYGTRTADQFNTGGKSDATYQSAANINSYITPNNQLAISGLENMTTSGNEWYYVNAPAGTASSMTVTVQSANLSSFAPHLQVYTSSMSLVGQVSAPDVLGATVSVTAAGVTAGAGYYIRVYAAGGPGYVGTYGLLVNFSTSGVPAVAPPNTVVTQQADAGGGVSNDNVAAVPRKLGLGEMPGSWHLNIGKIDVWSEGLAASAASTSPFVWLVNQAGFSNPLVNQGIILGALDALLADWNSKDQQPS